MGTVEDTWRLTHQKKFGKKYEYHNTDTLTDFKTILSA